jgi:EmrB/QacA subfamily drug resistance transporter
MAFIDGTVVNVALPQIQRSLEATAVDAQWIVEAYSLMLAALILVGGSLGDHYGRKRIFLLGVGLFALSSVWCGLAPNSAQLITARAVQGIGGALMVPGSLAIISAAFDEERRGKAIGTWSGFSGITTALGPVLGGYLIENVSWRAAFLINVPLAAVVILISLRHVPESRDPGAARLDFPGAVLATLGLGGIVYGLIQSNVASFDDPVVLASLALGASALVAFIFVERRSREPMMPLALFKSRNFSGANLLTLLLYAGLGGSLFFLPFVLIQVHGYSATAAGSAFLPFVVITFLLSRWAGGLVDRYGAKLPLTIGPIITAAGFLLFALPGTGGSYWTTFFPAIVVQGLGMSLVIAPLTTTALNAVEGRHSGLASGINNAISRSAGLLAIAVFGVFVFATFSSALDSRLASIDLPPAAREQMEQEKVRLGAAEPPEGVPDEQAARIEEAVDGAFVSGFRVVMFVSAGLAVGSALAAATLIEGKGHFERPEEAGQAETGASPV